MWGLRIIVMSHDRMRSEWKKNEGKKPAMGELLMVSNKTTNTFISQTRTAKFPTGVCTLRTFTIGINSRHSHPIVF